MVSDRISFPNPDFTLFGAFQTEALFASLLRLGGIGPSRSAKAKENLLNPGTLSSARECESKPRESPESLLDPVASRGHVGAQRGLE